METAYMLQLLVLIASAFSQPVELKPEVVGGAIVYRVDVAVLAASADLRLQMPPLDGTVVGVELAGSSTPICKVKAGNLGWVVPYEAPGASSACSWVYGIAPGAAVEVRVQTTAKDQIWRLELAPMLTPKAVVRLDPCTSDPNEPGCPDGSTKDEPVPVWRVDPADVEPGALEGDAYVLTRQWRPYRIPKQLLAPREAWRQLAGVDAGLVYLARDGVVYAVTLFKPGATPSDPAPAGWCRDDIHFPQQSSGARQVLCIDHSEIGTLGSVEAWRVANGGGVRSDEMLVANQPLTVILRYPPNAMATMRLEAPLGFEDGLVVPPAAGAGAAIEAVKAAPSVARSFPSLKSGAAKLIVSLKERKEGAVAVDHTYTFLVDREVWGAIRSGLVVGGSFYPEGAPYERYVVTTPAGSSTPTVADNGVGAPFDTELSFGLSVYIPDAAPGPTLESQLHKPRLSAYLGMGVIDLAATSPEDALPSLHVGPELSLGKNLGIAAVFSVRPTLALAAGITPGDYAESETLQGRVVLVPGISVVLNLTPDLLQLAATGVSR